MANDFITRTLARKNMRLLLIGSIAAIIMFGFGYAMVPLYNVLCTVTGLNGKTYSKSVPLMQQDQIDKSRIITVQFLTTTNAYLPWEFYAKTVSVDLYPGENKRVYFFAKNDSDHAMVVQAIPSVSPGIAAKYLKKTECFCFTQQRLEAHESKLMPVLFHLDPNLPKYITTLSLSYTLFDAEKVKQTIPHQAGTIS